MASRKIKIRKPASNGCVIITSRVLDGKCAMKRMYTDGLRTSSVDTLVNSPALRDARRRPHLKHTSA